ncbi:MAG: hypothetical protein V4649_19490 [Bacteroidota bacterium]
MTIVAWDQQIIAVDSLASLSGTTYAMRKWELYTFYEDKHILLITGNMAFGMQQMEWYKKGQAHEFPQAKEGEFGRLVVATPHGVHWYEGTNGKLESIGRYMALGSGMDFAIGAFHHGATAIEAVQAACEHDEACGGAIVAFNYRTGERIQ